LKTYVSPFKFQLRFLPLFEKFTGKIPSLKPHQTLLFRQTKASKSVMTKKKKRENANKT